MERQISLHQQLRRGFLTSIPPLPPSLQGRGIVVCGGGERYLPGIWVLLNELREVECRLPVQVWHLGEAEMPAEWHALFSSCGIVCVDALKIRETHPARILRGWELKPYAILHCPFKEVILLDADNAPLRDPEFLFDSRPFLETGAIFWPDQGRLGPERAIWQICEVEHRDEPEFESGQIVVDKARCWKELNLAMHMNEYSDFYYRHVHGDKETFHMAWRMLGTTYAMPDRGVEHLRGVFCQHDFEGERLFQHRAGGPKLKIDGNRPVAGLVNEERYFAHLLKLRAELSRALDCNSNRPGWVVNSDSSSNIDGHARWKER